MKIHQVSELLLRLKSTNPRKVENVVFQDFAKALLGFEDMEHKKFLEKIKILSRSDTDSSMAKTVITLYNMSQIGRNQWIEFAARNKIKIEPNTRDSARDVIGKILKFLALNPAVLKDIEKKSKVKKVEKRKEDKDSRQELEDTINILLKM